MSNSNDPLAELQARHVELESRYTHLQRIVDELNEVVIEQGRRLDFAERQISALKLQLGRIGEREAEPRSLEEERPPHY